MPIRTEFFPSRTDYFALFEGQIHLTPIKQLMEWYYLQVSSTENVATPLINDK